MKIILFYIIDQLINQGIKNLILYAGYKYKNVDEYLKKNFDNIKIETTYSNTNKIEQGLKIKNKLNDHFFAALSDNYTNFILKNRSKISKKSSLLELTMVKKKNEISHLINLKI